MPVDLVERCAQRGPGFGPFRLQRGSLAVGPDRGGKVLLGREGAAEHHQEFGAVGMDDQLLREDIYGAVVATDIAQGLGKGDGGFEVFRVLGMLLGPEVCLGQRIGAIGGSDLFRPGRLHRFFHGLFELLVGSLFLFRPRACAACRRRCQDKREDSQ